MPSTTHGPVFEWTGELHVKLRRPGLETFSTVPSQTVIRDVAKRIGASSGVPFLQTLPTGGLEALGIGPSEPLSELGRWFELRLPTTLAAMDAESSQAEVWGAVRELMAHPEVEYAEPDAIVRHPVPETLVMPTKPAALADDWHLQRIGAPQAWEAFAQRGYAPGDGIVIAHLDTGYTTHPAVPRERFVEPGRDFWKPDRADASDPLDQFFGALMPGHGTGTICILAANRPGYKGVALGSRVLPLRVSPSVVLVRTKALAQAVLYAVRQGARVITLSMGGLPSQLWADAINHAYERGVVVVAAAGNNFKLPLVRTPSSVVYPARFDRVIAVSGITAADQQYWTENWFEMCGNYGPEVDICAPTPGVLWAQPDGSFAPGAGTSTATPQVAGAAALWLSYHREALRDLSPVDQVEACRLALFRSAKDVGPFAFRARAEDPSRTWNEQFGDGRLDVAEALKIPPVAGLPRQPEAKVDWALWKLLTGLEIAETAAKPTADAIEALWMGEQFTPRELVRREVARLGTDSLRKTLAPSQPRTDEATLGGRLKSRRVLVIPPEQPQLESMELLATTATPSRRARLSSRHLRLTEFARQTVRVPAPLAGMLEAFSDDAAAAAGPAPITGVQILDAVGGFVVDGANVDVEALRLARARVIEDQLITLDDPEPEPTAQLEPSRWHLDAIGRRPTDGTGDGILVGVIDTGVDGQHPEFARPGGRKIHFKLWGNTSLVPAGAGPDFTVDAQNHGTHVCGLIVGKNVGVAPGADLAVASVLNEPTPSGAMTGSLIDLVTAYNWLRTAEFRGPDGEPGVDIINLSLGIKGYTDFLLEAVRTARLEGILTIAASGNSSTVLCSPGTYDNVLAVGAIDGVAEVAPFSSWGIVDQNGVSKPDLCAPGVGVVSSVPGGKYAAKDGTSMAAPIVTGLASLLLQTRPALRGDAGQLVAALQALATPPPAGPAAGRGAVRLRGPAPKVEAAGALAVAPPRNVVRVSGGGKPARTVQGGVTPAATKQKRGPKAKRPPRPRK